MRKVDLLLHFQDQFEEKKRSGRWWSAVKQINSNWGSQAATQDHEAYWTINPINNTNNTQEFWQHKFHQVSSLHIFGQIQPSWALSRFWQVCRHLFLVQHQPFRSACPTCQRALGSPCKTQSHAEIKFKTLKCSPQTSWYNRKSWKFMQIRAFENQDETFPWQLLANLHILQKSHLKHLYVLRTTSTPMATNLLLSILFRIRNSPKTNSHQLSKQRFRRSFSCIQTWDAKVETKTKRQLSLTRPLSPSKRSLAVFPIPLSPPWSSWHCFWRIPICAHLWWHLPIYHFSHPSRSPTPEPCVGFF